MVTPKPKPARAKKGIRRTTVLGSLPISKRTGCVDPHTGIEYASIKLMRSDQRLRHTLMLKDFARLVAEGTLGQDAWERLPIEDEAQYSRFRAYLTMGPDDGLFLPSGEKVGVREWRIRSILRLANHLRCPFTTLKGMATRNHWTLRAEIWDREMARQADEAWAEEKRSAARRQARLGASLQTLAERGVERLLVQLRSGAVEVTPSDVAKLADTGVKIERLAHDKSTSNDSQSRETRFVFEGAKPKWLDHSEAVVVADQIEHTVIEGER